MRDDRQLDVQAEREPEVVGGDDVRGVGDGDEDLIVSEEADGECAVAERELLREERRCRRVDVLAREVEVVEVVLLGERARDRRTLHPAVVDDDLAEPATRLLLLRECQLQLLGRQQGVADEERAQLRALTDTREVCRQGRGELGRGHASFSSVMIGTSMRAVCQRVREARVVVDGRAVGAIGAGLCVLLGVARADGAEQAARLAAKVARLRVFEDDEGRFDRSVLDAGGSVLAVSQFTLIADTTKGNRPSFAGAARPEQAQPLYDRFCAELRSLGVPVETGVFGARMEVELVNDGPVTIVVDV